MDLAPATFTMTSMRPDQITAAVLEQRRTAIQPIAQQLGFQLSPDASISTPPMVLLLGNHSSGKSSMINHLLDYKVQRTGIAPTDDGFTVLMHAEQERGCDGQALVTNQRLPFTGLADFGPGLVQHLESRSLPCELLKHILLIDSPGMIDSGAAESQRPYDFQAVVRWFAEHADLILLFFDPEKPGTTGETLSTLTEALVGIDHKMRIVMNKMDLFEGIRDFARTYGALCWNLSRCLQVKDMPHIYTTVIPSLVRDDPRLPLDDFAAALLELEKYISDLPARRADNVLSRVIEEGGQVTMHMRVGHLLRDKIRRMFLRSLTFTFIASVLGVFATWHLIGSHGWVSAPSAMAAAGTIILLLLTWYLPRYLADWKVEQGLRQLDALFREAYRLELIQRDRANDLQHRWGQVRSHLVKVITARGRRGLPRISARRQRLLEQVMQHDLPELRAR